MKLRAALVEVLALAREANGYLDRPDRRFLPQLDATCQHVIDERPGSHARQTAAWEPPQIFEEIRRVKRRIWRQWRYH